jgi:signal peptidase
VNRPSLRRIAHLVGLLVLIVSLIPFLLYAVPEAAGADHSFVVMSDSMAPAIPVGSIVLVEDKPRASAYQKNDVITFRTDDGTVPTTHRIIGVEQTENGRTFVTKGDANEDPDPGTVSPGQVLGEVSLSIPYAGHLVIFANSKYGFYALVALPLFLLLVDTAWGIVTDRSADDDADRTTETASRSAASERGSGDVDRSAEADGESRGGSFTLTPNDLRVTAVVLVLFTAYSAWTVTRSLTAVTAAVAVATGFTTLTVLGILVATRGEGTDGGRSSTSDRVVEPDVPDATPSSGHLPSVPKTANGGTSQTEAGERSDVVSWIEAADRERSRTDDEERPVRGMDESDD